VKRLLVRESHVQPLLLVFEDLHWIDAESQALLDSLVEILAGTRVLLLVNYRPEYEHRWGGKSYYTQLRITPLKSESADQLLSSLLGSDASLQPLKQLLIERTEGNPFFLEESVRTLIETRALAGERGAYRLTRDVTAIQVAPTVQAVLAARIDRLPSEEKRLLQSAAVLGKDVPFVLLGSSPNFPTKSSIAASPGSRPRSSCTRRACSRIRNSPSSTPSRTTWPTGACSRTGAARCTPGSWKPSRPVIPTASSNISSRWPTMRSGARPGRGH
jgi:hypothetical protein